MEIAPPPASDKPTTSRGLGPVVTQAVRHERKAIRIRMEPNARQLEALVRVARARRFVYNWGLARWREYYAQTGETIPFKQLSSELTILKHEPETAWLMNVNGQSLQQALADLRCAYISFFRRHTNYPRFKSRKRDSNRFRIPQNVSISGNLVYVPKVGYVRLSESPDLSGMTLKSATFKETPSGEWFVAVWVKFKGLDKQSPIVDSKRAIGIDLGLKELAVLSNGERIANPRWYRSQEYRLRRAQRALSRKQKGSRNRTKARLRVARLYEKTRNRRQDFIHKLTTKLSREYDTIVVEDLSLQGMARTKLSKSVLDAALGEIRWQLEYKTRWTGKNLVVIDRWFPSPKLCNKCKAVYAELTLDERKWTCGCCNTTHDRDLNAALNIRAEGLRTVAVGHTETLNACGDLIRRSKSARVVEARTPCTMGIPEYTSAS